MPTKNYKIEKMLKFLKLLLTIIINKYLLSHFLFNITLHENYQINNTNTP